MLFGDVHFLFRDKTSQKTMKNAVKNASSVPENVRAIYRAVSRNALTVSER